MQQKDNWILKLGLSVWAIIILVICNFSAALKKPAVDTSIMALLAQIRSKAFGNELQSTTVEYATMCLLW